MLRRFLVILCISIDLLISLVPWALILRAFTLMQELDYNAGVFYKDKEAGALIYILLVEIFVHSFLGLMLQHLNVKQLWSLNYWLIVTTISLLNLLHLVAFSREYLSLLSTLLSLISFIVSLITSKFVLEQRLNLVALRSGDLDQTSTVN